MDDISSSPTEIRIQDTPSRWCYLKYITVEPSVTLYMLAFMITSVVEQSLFVYKACKVDHGYNETVCRNINEEKYSDINKEVQITVTNFLLWNNIAWHAGQIILAFFMGSWSDRRGRKLPLIIGLIGKLYYSLMIVLNASQSDWPVMYIVYTATLPMTITGSDVAVFSAAFSYLADVSNTENRTLRLTLLEVCYLATMPIGIALGSLIYSRVHQSYMIMFTINASLLVLAILYALLLLDWQTSANQKPISEASNLFVDFFDWNHVKDTAKVIYKRRANKKRRILLILIFMMGLYTFERSESSFIFLYCQRVFNWSMQQYSKFRTFQSALQDIGLLFGVTILSKLWSWRDTLLIMIGAVAHIIARVFYIIASKSWLLYIGAGFAAFGPIVAPVIRAMLSKLVPVTEKGKVFSVLGLADNASLIAGVLYSQVYRVTIKSYPAAVYFITIASQTGVLILALYIHFIYNEDEVPDEYEEEQAECLINEDRACNEEST